MLLLWTILAIVALVLWACVCRLLLTNPRGDLATGAWVWAMKAYARVMHRLAVRGAENVPKSVQAGPLIVVANHTAGVDPLLMQSACRFEIRWVMAKDMRHPAFEAFWRWSQIVFVDRASGEVNGTREALRHVREGGVLGIFPEGGLERPSRVIRPFHRGIGFIIKKTGAKVLPVVIEGTPQVDPAWASLWKRSRSQITFMPIIDYSGSKLRAGDIADDLRARYIAWTGWEAGARDGTEDAAGASEVDDKDAVNKNGPGIENRPILRETHEPRARARGA